MTDSMTAAEYRKRMGINDPAEYEISADEYRRMQAEGAFSPPEPRRNGSEVDTEPPMKREFQEWLLVELPIELSVASEHRIIPDRKFRADWAIMELKIAIEYDGIADHATLKGAWRDAEKGNLAQLEGWMFLRVNAKSIRDGSAYDVVRRAIELRSKS